MSITIYPGYQQFWTGTGAFDGNFVLGQGGTIYVGDFYFDTSTFNIYIITAIGSFDPDTQTYSGCTITEVVSAANVLATLDTLGWGINTETSLSSPSVSFNTPRTPSVTNYIYVYATIGLSSTALIAATVNILIGGNIVGQLSLSGLTETESDFAGFLVPANTSYELNITSGSPTLLYLKELSF
jgi:hypothetical protein